MMNLSGIIIGLACFVVTGIFHPIVIKCEYYFGAKVWPVFLVIGLASLGVSLMIGNDILSGMIGVLGFCLLLKEQIAAVLMVCLRVPEAD